MLVQTMKDEALYTYSPNKGAFFLHLKSKLHYILMFARIIYWLLCYLIGYYQ